MSTRSDGFKVRDASSYDPVVDAFDRLGRFTAPLATHLVAQARLQPSDAVLDVGTGTGIVALIAAEAVREGGRVVGVDLSDGMLRAARAKAEDRGLAVEFRKMDAESLELEPESFDVVLSLFALSHFPDVDAALRGIFRVLRPGGRIVVGVGGGPPIFDLTGWIDRSRQVARVALERLGLRLVAPRALNRLVQQHVPADDEPEETTWMTQSRNKGRELALRIRGAGFEDVRTSWVGSTAEIGSPDEFWELQATLSSSARKRLARAPEEVVRVLRAEFSRACRGVQERGGKLLYPSAAACASALRP